MHVSSEPPAVIDEPAAGTDLSTSEFVFNCICDLIVAGKTLKEICVLPGMPTRRTVQRWVNKNPEFAELLEEAREARCEDMASECITIADDAENDFELSKEQEEGKGEGAGPVMLVNKEAIARTKIRLAERHWWLSVTCPKRYHLNRPTDKKVEILPPLPGQPNGGVVVLEEDHPLRREIEEWRKASHPPAAETAK